MRAILMLAQLHRKCRKLIDKMADVGDFDVSPDFFDSEKIEILPPAPVDTAQKAFAQGCNAAAHDSVEEGHNPYPEGTEEAEAWLKGFQEQRTPPERTPAPKPARKPKARAKQ